MAINKGTEKEECESVCVCVCVWVVEYYLAIKKNEIMPFITTGMIGIIILSEKKSEGDKYISLTHGI